MPRRTTDEYPIALRIGTLHRRGCFCSKPGKVSFVEVTWMRGGGPFGRLGAVVDVGESGAGRLVFRFFRHDAGRSSLAAAGVIRLVSTPCRFGGARWWFECPLVGGRCAVLYLQGNGIFGSRRALGLAYASQRKGRNERFYEWLFLGDRIDAYESSIRYPYRNGKPTRKMRRCLRLRGGCIGAECRAQLEASMLSG